MTEKNLSDYQGFGIRLNEDDGSFHAFQKTEYSDHQEQVEAPTLKELKKKIDTYLMTKLGQECYIEARSERAGATWNDKQFFLAKVTSIKQGKNYAGDYNEFRVTYKEGSINHWAEEPASVLIKPSDANKITMERIATLRIEKGRIETELEELNEKLEHYEESDLMGATPA